MLIGILVVGLAIGIWFAFTLFGSADKKRAAAEANPEPILNEAFDGRPNVVFAINAETLRPETVILGAKARGYRVSEKIGNQYGVTSIIFEKA